MDARSADTMTREEVSEFLGITVGKVTGMCALGELERVNGNALRQPIKTESVLAFSYRYPVLSDGTRMIPATHFTVEPGLYRSINADGSWTWKVDVHKGRGRVSRSYKSEKAARLAHAELLARGPSTPVASTASAHSPRRSRLKALASQFARAKSPVAYDAMRVN